MRLRRGGRESWFYVLYLGQTRGVTYVKFGSAVDVLDRARKFAAAYVDDPIVWQAAKFHGMTANEMERKIKKRFCGERVGTKEVYRLSPTVFNEVASMEFSRLFTGVPVLDVFEENPILRMSASVELDGVQHDLGCRWSKVYRKYAHLEPLSDQQRQNVKVQMLRGDAAPMASFLESDLTSLGIE